MSIIPSHVRIEGMTPLSVNECKVALTRWPNCDVRSTSEKNIQFISQPMGNKSAIDLPGITDVLAMRLEERGFEKAQVLLGQFLVLKKNKQMFIAWLQSTIGATRAQAALCYDSLSDWSSEFM